MNKERIAVFPGSFDPITKGHENVIRRALPLFDKIIIAIGINSTKNSLFTLEQRKQWIETVFSDEPKIEISTYEGLTVDFCTRKNAGYIIRGLRNTTDFEYEKAIAQMNAAMKENIETVFLITDPAHAAINSSIVREIHKNKGDIQKFIPDRIEIQ